MYLEIYICQYNFLKKQKSMYQFSIIIATFVKIANDDIVSYCYCIFRVQFASIGTFRVNGVEKMTTSPRTTKYDHLF